MPNENMDKKFVLMESSSRLPDEMVSYTAPPLKNFYVRGSSPDFGDEVVGPYFYEDPIFRPETSNFSMKFKQRFFLITLLMLFATLIACAVLYVMLEFSPKPVSANSSIADEKNQGQVQFQKTRQDTQRTYGKIDLTGPLKGLTEQWQKILKERIDNAKENYAEATSDMSGAFFSDEKPWAITEAVGFGVTNIDELLQIAGDWSVESRKLLDEWYKKGHISAMGYWSGTIHPPEAFSFLDTANEKALQNVAGIEIFKANNSVFKVSQRIGFLLLFMAMSLQGAYLILLILLKKDEDANVKKIIELVIDTLIMGICIIFLRDIVFFFIKGTDIVRDLLIAIGTNSGGDAQDIPNMKGQIDTLLLKKLELLNLPPGNTWDVIFGSLQNACVYTIAWVMFYLVSAVTFALFLLNDIMMAFSLAIGPIILALSIFHPVSNFRNSWINNTISYLVLSPLITIFCMLIIVVLNLATSGFTWAWLVTITVVIFFVALKLPTLAQQMSAQAIGQTAFQTLNLPLIALAGLGAMAGQSVLNSLTGGISNVVFNFIGKIKNVMEKIKSFIQNRLG